jgi:hypothetical protein
MTLVYDNTATETKKGRIPEIATVSEWERNLQDQQPFGQRVISPSLRKNSESESYLPKAMSGRQG